MKRRMEQLINGRFEYEVPAFITSESEIHLQIPEGRNQKGEFSIGAEDGSRVKGVVTSDNRRIVLAKDRFSGSTSRIVYGIDTQGLVCGEQITGTIVLGSNIGEKKIPVTAEIVEVQVQTARGSIRTLEEFTRLAMKDPREAFRLFTSGQFYKILEGKNSVYTALYSGMSHNPVTYQHMEEFLIASKEKKPVILSLEDKKGVYQIGHSLKDTLYVYKNIWGYVRMEIEAVGDFLQVEKKVVTTDDFIGSVYGLEFVVRKDKMGQGRSFGKIIVKSVHQTLEFEIVASIEQGQQLLPKGLRKRKTLELARDYLDMQFQRMDYRTWFDKTAASMDELTQAECMDSMLTLYEAYVYYMNENITKAMELLWEFRQESMTLTTPREQGIYLYLAKKVNLLAPEMHRILPKIKAYLQQQPEDFFLTMILLDEEESSKNTPIQQLHLMEKAFELGCKSPFLYLHAYQLLKHQEGMMRKLSPFMVQVLNFAEKQDVLSESLLKRAAYLSDNLKEFSPFVYRILAKGYDRFPSDEVLEAVCKLLMKGDPTRKEYFRWYSLAVEREVRITRLYEYYIETMGEDNRQMLPQVIRMYFAYNNTLNARKKAFIYANVIRNKERDKTTYINYRKAMEQFAREQMCQGRINGDFAVIYQEFVTRADSRKIAEGLVKVLFMQKVSVGDRKIRKVIVCHNALQGEQVYPVTDQCAYVNLYGQNAQILFEDEKRRRFAATISYNVEKMIEERGMVKTCADFLPEHPGILLYLCGELPSQMEITPQNLVYYQTVAEDDAFTGEYRAAVRKKLLNYYMAQPQEPELKEYLKKADVQAYAKIDRADTVQVLVSYQMYEQAFSIVSQWGMEGVDVMVLMKLASQMILNMEFEAEEELLYLADYVLQRETYDEVILIYLRDYYVGSVDQMTKLWEKVKGFQLESFRLDERILMISMYVRTFPENSEKVLNSYIMQQGREMVVLAYLTYVSCAYFMTGRETDQGFFSYLEKTYERGWEMDTICHLALLKYYASCEHLTKKQEEQAAELLKEFDQKGLRFAFFQKLPLHLIQAYQVEDKVFVEEKFRSGSRVVIHYSLCQNGGEPMNFKSEPMRDMYQGIFTKEFLLFYGEKLTYYLTVEQNGDTIVTPQKEIALSRVEARGRTRYKLLNQILAAKELGNQEVVELALKLYLQQETFVDNMFQLME